MVMCLSLPTSASNTSSCLLLPSVSDAYRTCIQIHNLRSLRCQCNAIPYGTIKQSNPNNNITLIGGSNSILKHSKALSTLRLELVCRLEDIRLFSSAPRIRSSISSSKIIEQTVKLLTGIVVRRGRSQISAEEDIHAIEQTFYEDSGVESPAAAPKIASVIAFKENFATNAQKSSATFAAVVSNKSPVGWKYFPRTSRPLAVTPILTFTRLFLGLFVVWSLVEVAVKKINGKFKNRPPQQSFKRKKTSKEKNLQPSSSRSVFQAPSTFSLFLERDLRRKESVEWVNMVLGKLWKVYRLGLEDWLVGLLQPLIDNLKKPGYVQRVQIKQFFLGDEPLSVRSVERRTSRRAHDLQYHIGLRYTGGARMLLSIILKVGIFPLSIPVGVRGLDVDGELWVKLQLVPSEPWVGTATWAFVSLPKITMALAPFGLFNLMAIPFLSAFLTKLLTEDLPQLFVRPNKTVLNFMQGKTLGPTPKDFKDGASSDCNKDFSGELSVTVIDARKLHYIPIGKPDPYVVLMLGDQVTCSKKNSQTSIFGPPGAPIWNQDFQLLVVNPKMQRLAICVRDTFGLTAFTVGHGEVNLSTLQDTVPCDKIVTLKGGWGPFLKQYAGDVVLRLTYKAYVEDEEEDREEDGPLANGNLDLDDEKIESNSLLHETANTSADSDEDSSSRSFLSNLIAAISLAADDQGLTNGFTAYPEFFDKLEPGPGPKETENQNNVTSHKSLSAEENDYKSMKGWMSKLVAWGKIFVWRREANDFGQT
ncbi:hypothetical protein O6H91_07G008200 [Diphasiastrum complanatum]|uniref:Uncharacterized protein n=2 Tax=Diphasiastrum complanatum TaxID=34168 RepID=A0ACC2D2F3_DIPCM|nr:hypothetical protein O6H91_07G008200 [Diphasiastrum complanatum]KAJ7548349.1 hypothetical protein O6H91_07G008200 [Diphasiastrum complanatum]